MKKIDVHIHTRLWAERGPRRTNGETYATPEQIREIFKKLGIEKGIILPGIGPYSAFCIQSNEEAWVLAEEYPDLFYWFCNIDPHMGDNSPTTDFSRFLNFYKERGAKGVGELTANLYTDDPLLDNLFYHCGECNMPVTIHIAPQIGGCYGIVDEVGLPRLEKMLKKHPRLKIIGHSQPFWAEISSDATTANRNSYPSGKVKEGRLVHLMREYENLYCDLSAGSGYNALSRDPDFGYRFIEEFSDRLIFGTDICSPSNHMPLSGWLDKALAEKCISEQNYKRLSRENAIRLLKL